MKTKLLTFLLALTFLFFFSGCSFYEDIEVKEVKNVLDKADAAFLNGDKDEAYELYKKAMNLGYDFGKDVLRSKVCGSIITRDINNCIYLQVLATEKNIEDLSYPKVTNHVWIVNNESISPFCMTYIMMSADYYEGYEEQYPQAEDFRDYPGKYWGNIVPLEPIKMIYLEKFHSIPKSLETCNKIGPKDLISIKKNIFSHSEIIESRVTDDNRKYTLLAEWGKEGCSKVMPQLADQCQSLVFVKLNHTYRIFEIGFNSYAHVIVKDKSYIVPVTNGMPLEDLLKLIESN